MIGIIASVLVSFTVTALSKVAEPRLYMESQMEAAAVTEEMKYFISESTRKKVDLHIFQGRISWYYDTYKEPITSVGKGGEKL